MKNSTVLLSWNKFFQNSKSEVAHRDSDYTVNMRIWPNVIKANMRLRLQEFYVVFGKHIAKIQPWTEVVYLY